MKRRLLTVLFALLLLLLCGCAALVPSEYTLVTPHNPGTKTEQQSDVLTVSNYKICLLYTSFLFFVVAQNSVS